MVYSLLRDQAVEGWSPFLEKEDGTALTIADVRKGLDNDLSALGVKIASEPLAHVDPAELTAFYFPPVESAPGEPVHVTKVRLPRAGKPDPRTWGWQSGDGAMPPGLEP